MAEVLLLDRYKLIERAGKGGYGTVHRAYDTRLQREVAIKCIKLSPEDAARSRAAENRSGSKSSESASDGASDRRPLQPQAAEEQPRPKPKPLIEFEHPTLNPDFPSAPRFLDAREDREMYRRRDHEYRSNSGGGRYGYYEDGRGNAYRVGSQNDGYYEPAYRRDSSGGFGRDRYENDRYVDARYRDDRYGDDRYGDDGYRTSGDRYGDSRYGDSRRDGSAAAGRSGSRGYDSYGEYGYDGYDYDDGTDRYDDYGEYGYDAYAYDGYADSRDMRGSAPAEEAARNERAAGPLTQIIQVAAPAAVKEARMSTPPATPASSDDEDPLAHIPGLEEARTAARLSDVNIVTVYDCEVHNGIAYIIMEYVEGKTLTQVLREVGDNITLDMVAAVFDSVTHALKAAHKKKVLHLDIKPDNVIIDKDGLVRVTDFGLATLADSAGHATTGGGTIGYMPLEQMRLKPLDVRTDEWALASLTYEMLVGVNPFLAPDLTSAESAIEGAELILPSSRWNELTTDIDDPIFSALSPDPDGRYQTIAAFASAVKPQLGNVKKGKKELAAAVAENDRAPLAASTVSSSLLMSALAAAPKRDDAKASVKAAKDDDADEVPAKKSKRKAKEEAAEEPDDEEYAPGAPLVDRIGPEGGSIFMRVAVCVSVAFLAVFSLINIHATSNTPLGLASSSLAVFIILVAGAVVAAAIRSGLGALIAIEMLAVSIIANGNIYLGLILAIVAGLWWWYFAKDDVAQAFSVLCTPVFGAFGFGAVGPIVAGSLMPIRSAAPSIVFSTILALIFACFGSGDLMNWQIYAYWDFSAVPMEEALVRLTMAMETWCIALSWVLAGVVYSLCCSVGMRKMDIAGSILAAACLIAGVCLVSVFLSPGESWALGPMAFIGAAVPGIVGVLLAYFGVSDRARWDEEEWEEFRESTLYG